MKFTKNWLVTVFFILFSSAYLNICNVCSKEEEEEETAMKDTTTSLPVPVAAP